MTKSTSTRFGIGAGIVLTIVITGAAFAKPPYKVLYNNDSTNILGCESPWNPKPRVFTDETIVASIDEVVGHGVDCYMLSPGLGWIPMWPSKVYPDHYKWWTEKTGLPPDVYGRYMLDGGDLVKVFVDRCRAKGLAPFVSFRVNDTHHQENVGKKIRNSIWVCRFYEEHPEYMLRPDHVNIKGYSHYRGQNWVFREVRDYKFALIRELCETYDLAGLELDFLRDNHIFDLKATTAEQRIEIITGFIVRIRKMLDGTACQGQRRYLSMRIPCDLAAHPSTGLDVGKLAAAGVDMFNLSGWYHTTQQNDVAAVRKLVPEAAIYLEMTHSAGSLYFACGKSAYGTASFPRTSDIQFYTTAHKAYEDGADGVSLFNFVYFRDHGTAKCAVINEPPFHVLDHIADRAWLAKQPQHYWLGRWVFKSAFADPNVRTLAADNPTTITLNLAPPRKPRSESARLRIHTKDPIPEGCDITIELNGTALDTSNDLSPLYGNPYDGMISDTPRRRSWTFPASNAREGVNDIVIRADAEKPMELTWLELAIE